MLSNQTVESFVGRAVLVTGMKARSGKIHRHVRKYVGRSAWLIGRSKNGQALLEFKIGYVTHLRAIPWGCIELRTEAQFVYSSKLRKIVDRDSVF